MALQRRYRAKNAAVRGTEPPAYFAEEPKRPFAPDASIIKELTTVKAAEGLMLDLRKELSDLHKQANDTKKQIRSLSAAALNAVPAYFAQIEHIAPVLGTTSQDGSVSSVSENEPTQ